MEKKHISILGCGWLGIPLGRRLAEEGHYVMGSTTTREKFGTLSAAGIVPHLINLESKPEASDFFEADFLVIAVPPKLRSQAAGIYLQQMQTALNAVESGHVAHVVFISSTSVYPDLNREVTEEDVDEKNTLAEAEKLFTSGRSFSTSVVRFAGLVGPGRHPGRFLSGRKTSGGDNPVNIIHLEDCIGIIVAIMENGKPLIVNGCADGHPTKREFYTHAAHDLNVEPPVFDETEKIPFKIVSNALVRKELGYAFVFPDPMTMKF
jgi:nucleoside-diphosphate-sugar epimerase